MWSRTLKWSVKSYVTGPSTKCYFNEYVFICGSSHIRLLQRLWVFKVPWSRSGFPLSLPPRGSFCKKSKWLCNMIHSMPCRNPCRLYIHQAFTYSFRWSLKCSVKANLDRLRHFHQWECLKCNGHGLLSSCVKWPSIVRSLFGFGRQSVLCPNFYSVYAKSASTIIGLFWEVHILPFHEKLQDTNEWGANQGQYNECFAPPTWILRLYCEESTRIVKRIVEGFLWFCNNHGEVTPLSSKTPHARQVCYPYVTWHR